MQILSEYCSDDGDRTSDYSFELNVVLHDGRRIRVADHGNYGKLSAATRSIAEMLDVPVRNVSAGWPRYSRERRRKR